MTCDDDDGDDSHAVTDDMEMIWSVTAWHDESNGIPTHLHWHCWSVQVNFGKYVWAAGNSRMFEARESGGPTVYGYTV